MNIKALVFVAALAIPAIATAQSGSTTSGSTTGSTKSGSSQGTSSTQGTGSQAGGMNGAKAGAKLEGADLEVVSHLNHVNKMEIDMGKLAQKQGTGKVKQYGATLIKDHTAANKDLAAMAKKKGVAKIPAEKPTSEAMQKEHQDAMDAMAKMKKLKGAEFDREFLTMMVADHDKTIARVDSAMATAQDPELKTFLSTIRPTLQRHADQARQLQSGTSEVSSAGSTNTGSKPGANGSTMKPGSSTGTTGSSSGSRSGTSGSTGTTGSTGTSGSTGTNGSTGTSGTGTSPRGAK